MTQQLRDKRFKTNSNNVSDLKISTNEHKTSLQLFFTNYLAIIYEHKVYEQYDFNVDELMIDINFYPGSVRIQNFTTT